MTKMAQTIIRMLTNAGPSISAPGLTSLARVHCSRQAGRGGIASPCRRHDGSYFSYGDDPMGSEQQSAARQPPPNRLNVPFVEPFSLTPYSGGWDLCILVLMSVWSPTAQRSRCVGVFCPELWYDTRNSDLDSDRVRIASRVRSGPCIFQQARCALSWHDLSPMWANFCGHGPRRPQRPACVLREGERYD